MKQRKKIKCRHCGTFFYPNPRNMKNQRYCSKHDCRKASKVASQHKWVLKNPDYFRSRENVARVQAWRKKHPSYSKSKSKKYSNEPLQDSIIDKCLENQVVKEHLPTPALQDLISSQPLVLIGLIAKLTGFTLQDEIDLYTRRLLTLGSDILLSSVSPQTGGHYEAKTSYLPGKIPPDTETV